MENATNEAPRRRGRRPADTDLDLQASENAVPRSEMRPAMREEDPRERAARRAAELRGHLGEMDDGTDEFYIDVGIVPDGWTYEWKRRLILGAEDPSYAVHIARMGWEPVPVSRHPDMMPSNWTGTTIERKGMILMERPSEITDEARQIERKRARDQVRAKESQLAGTPDGTMTRDHDKVRPSIKKSFEAVPIPKE